MFLFIIFHVTYVIDIHSVVFVLSPFLNVKQAKQPAACGNESTENKKTKVIYKDHHNTISTPLSYVLDSS